MVYLVDSLPDVTFWWGAPRDAKDASNVVRREEIGDLKLTVTRHAEGGRQLGAILEGRRAEADFGLYLYSEDPVVQAREVQGFMELVDLAWSRWPAYNELIVPLVLIDDRD